MDFDKRLYEAKLQPNYTERTPSGLKLIQPIALDKEASVLEFDLCAARVELLEFYFQPEWGDGSR